MKIYGIGTDIVQCARIAKMWSEHGMHFASRILSTAEFDALEQQKANPVAFLAKRFAAKEAIVKALGTGFRDEVLITQIGIATDSKGKPSVVFYGVTKQFVEQLGNLEIHISLSDEAEYVVAFVLVCIVEENVK